MMGSFQVQRFRTLFVLFLFQFFATGCNMLHLHPESSFSYRPIPVATDSIPAGDGSHVLFKGTPIPLSGQAIQIGDTLRSAEVTRPDLTRIDIAGTNGRVRIISIVPSLDTPVCEQQTHYLSEKNDGLDRHVTLITISIDTPFAQARFAREAGIHNVTFYSDYRNGAFGKTHGLFLDEPHILTRAIMVVDRDNTIRHLQIPPELGQLPGMEAAFTAARALVDSSPHP